MTLALTSIAHLLVDGVCAASVLGAEADAKELALMLFIYNTLAFSTQCIVGLILDRTGRAKDIGRISLLVLALGAFVPFGNIARSCIMGIGNSMFHVACGSMTIMKYPGRAAELGIFVAPGALGICLGSLYPKLKPLFAIGLLAAGALLGHVGKDGFDYNLPPETSDEDKTALGEAVLLTAAVAVRSMGGYAVHFPWNKGAATALLLSFFVFAGKAAGGILMQKLGTIKTSLMSLVPSAVCIVLLAELAVPSVVGQFLLNVSMPVTLWLLVRALPGSPGLAFGLAASALWPGALAGEMIAADSSGSGLLITLSFAFGLWAVLFCERRLEK